MGEDLEGGIRVLGEVLGHFGVPGEGVFSGKWLEERGVGRGERMERWEEEGEGGRWRHVKGSHGGGRRRRGRGRGEEDGETEACDCRLLVCSRVNSRG